MKEMKKYKVYDCYFCRELIGEANTLVEVKEICRKRNEDTDGEWWCIVKELGSDGKYHDAKSFLW